MSVFAYISPLGEAHAALADSEDLWAHNRGISKVMAQVMLDIGLCTEPAETVWAQLGVVANVDVSVLMPLSEYLSEETIEELSENEEPEVFQSMQDHNQKVLQKLENNVPLVLATLDALLANLKGVTGLYARLNLTEELADWLGEFAPVYFQDFGTRQPRSGDPTLESDLQALRNGMQYMQTQGVTTACLFITT